MLTSRTLVAFCLGLLILVEGAGPNPLGQSADGSKVIAFVDVNVVPMDRERIMKRQTVIVRDGRIAEIGPTAQIKVPEGAMRIDGRGKYLMPGLADMHVHVNRLDEASLLLFVANGVTTVRNMWGTSDVLGWRQKIAHGDMLGPTIYTTGPLIDGKPPSWPDSTVVETPEEAKRVVAEQQQAGYDFIKVYGGLSSEVYGALVAAAGKHGLRAVGHVPRAVGLEGVLKARQSSIEHLEGYILALQSDDSLSQAQKDQPIKPEDRLRRFQETLDHIDPAKLPKVAAATREAGVWNCPTLVVMKKITQLDNAQELQQRSEMKYVPPLILERWDPAKDFRFKSWTKTNFDLARRAYDINKKLTKGLHDASARLLLGTDTPNPYVVPGFSTHEELQHLVEAGLTPYEAIKAATRDAAEFLNALAEFGTVELGKRADLILIEANPLENVANVAKRVGVMVRGKWFPQTGLQQMLDELAASYGTRNRAPQTDSALLLARRLMDMWESGDTAALDEITTDDVVYDDVPNTQRFEGREGVRRYIKHVHAWAGHIEIEVTAVHGGEKAALAEWIMRGVQDRPIPGRVPVATNRRFELKGATLVELREGKIARAADYLDVLGLVVQLGGRVELPGGAVIPPK
jgi:steroid delta-isomerase-like uncharacterized protein